MAALSEVKALAILQIKELLISMSKEDAEYIKAREIVKRREVAEGRIKKLVQKHRVTNAIKATDEDNNTEITAQFVISTMRRVSNDLIPLHLIEDYKEDSEVWRKTIIFDKTD